MTLASQSVIASEIEMDGVKCTVHFSILVPDKSDDSACAKRKGIMRFRNLSRETVTFPIGSLPNASASAGSAPAPAQKRGESLEKTRLKNNKDVGFMMVLLYHACTKKSMVLYNFQLFI